MIQFHRFCTAAAGLSLLAVASQSHAAITVYTTRASFLAAVSAPGVDGFDGFSVVASTPSPIMRTGNSPNDMVFAGGFE